ncbi:MAG: oligosaccharide flippase family protein, partial [Clostridia bacterium]|nr:oligosaccharide flippase family protein [Clostridia bacterium]
MERSKDSTVAGILRASAIMGSSSAVSIVAGIIKAKVMAVLLGPTGIGFMGLLQSILTTVGTLSGMGLASSGVREIAAAQANGAPERMARTRSALWWAAVVFGLLGALALVLLREPIARFTFGTTAYSYGVAWLSIGVWATTISGAQTALLNGLRRLGDLAKVNIFGSLAAMIIGVVAVWQWGIAGVVVAVVIAPLTTMAVSWWLTRGLMSPEATVTLKELREPWRRLLSLGVVFMTTALMSVGTQFLVRLIVTRTLGLDATGHFQAAWSIS